MKKETVHQQRRARWPLEGKRLRRSQNKKLAGVAAGLAEFIDADPKTLRWVFAALSLLSGGLFLICYGLLWWLLPGAE